MAGEFLSSGSALATAGRRRLIERHPLRVIAICVAALLLGTPVPPPLAPVQERALVPLQGRLTVNGVVPTDLPDGLRPIAPAAAIALNAIFPPGPNAGPPAVAFRLMPQRSEDYQNALNCLAMAVYYEAATESREGQRAVAQVVLNRVRHPAFPNTVCGVVFQGSQRRTGCQFTFTCDGSRMRMPSVSGWARAREVAAGALAGDVYEEVGLATHYHANYVLPYWASSLIKSAQVGTHIFYRWSGTAGTRSAFQQSWAGTEPGIPAFRPPQAGTSAVLASGSVPVAAAAGAIETPTSNVSPPIEAPRLRADERRGGLIADERRGQLLIDR